MKNYLKLESFIKILNQLLMLLIKSQKTLISGGSIKKDRMFYQNLEKNLHNIVIV